MTDRIYQQYRQPEPFAFDYERLQDHLATTPADEVFHLVEKPEITRTIDGAYAIRKICPNWIFMPKVTDDTPAPRKRMA
ncbi:hypothetical protein AB8880_04570 [Alphaproteobacteria bacterium LSUCC0684]